jgi:hypothetical protein
MHLDIALPPNTFARRKEDLMGLLGDFKELCL